MTLCASILGDVNALKCELAGEVLRSSGTLRLQVTGWSMLPAVLPGDTLVIEHIHSGAVSPGDIVLFGRDRRFFVHRVVAGSQSQSGAVLTRGDALPATDPPVPAGDLLGRVSFILRNGKIYSAAPQSAPFRTRRRGFGSTFGLRCPCRGEAYTACARLPERPSEIQRHGFKRHRFKRHRFKRRRNREVPCQS